MNTYRSRIAVGALALLLIGIAAYVFHISSSGPGPHASNLEPGNEDRSMPQPQVDRKPVEGRDRERLLHEMREAGQQIFVRSDPASVPDDGMVSVQVELKSDSPLVRPLILVSQEDSTIWQQADSVLATFHCHAGAMLQVRATADGHFVVKASLLAEEGMRHVLLLEAYGSVFGAVLQPDGRPAAGAHVQLEPDRTEETKPGNKVFAAVTDDAGLFRLERVNVGNYRLSARKTPFSPAGPIALTINPLELLEGLQLQLEDLPMLSGVVVDSETGAPVDLARVEALDARSGITQGMMVTTSDGRFEFSLRHKLPAIRLVASRIGFDPAELPVDLPHPEEIRIELPSVGSPLTISVIDKASGRPLPSVSVKLTGTVLVGNDSPPALTEDTDASGKCLFPHVGTGVYKAKATVDGYISNFERFSMEGDRPARVRIELVPASTIHVQFLDAHGTPTRDALPNSYWMLYPRPGQFDRSGKLPQDLDYGAPRLSATIQATPPGEYDLYVLVAGFLPSCHSLSIPAEGGYESTVTVRLQERTPSSLAASLPDSVLELLASQPEPLTHAEDHEFQPVLEQPMILEGGFERGAARLLARRLRGGFFEAGTTSTPPVQFQLGTSALIQLDATAGLTLVLPTGQVIPLLLDPESPGQLLARIDELSTASGFIELPSSGSPIDGESYILALCPVAKTTQDLPAIDAMDCTWVRLDPNSPNCQIPLVSPDLYVAVLFRSPTGWPDGSHVWIGTSYYLPLDLTGGRTGQFALPR